MDGAVEPLSTRTDAADDLTATNDPDLMANEQTWPTEEEMAGAGSASGTDGPKRMKRVPKGTSAYQAAWIVDDDEDEDGDDDEDDEDMSDGEDAGDAGSMRKGFMDEGEETEDIELDSRRGDAHRDMDDDQEEVE